MKSVRTSNRYLPFKRLVFAGVCLLPALASAHPGHYHPDESDEFDFFRATFFHTHGALEYVLAGLVILNIAVVCLNHKPVVRFAALALAIASLSAISVL
ncbi:MAG: hypothetical protein ABIT37_21245 [Luteolibacter sp.]